MKYKNRSMYGLLILALAALMIIPPAGILADDDEELDFFLQEAEVTTASRRKQKVSESPVTIEVITREQIKAFGALQIWDVLRFATGLDITEAHTTDGNRAVVSLRGFQEEFQASLQVLLDGVPVMSSVNGGVNWHRIPVQINEIERIEIIRGPNSALFGSNAGLGVINIITRKAGDSFSVESGGLGGTRELYRARIAGEGYGVRISAERGGRGESPVTKTPTDKSGSTIGVGGVSASPTEYNNSMNFTRISLNGAWVLGEKTTLNLGVNTSHHFQDVDFFAMDDGRGKFFEDNIESIKLTHDMTPDNTVELQLSRFDAIRSLGYLHTREVQYNFEALDRFSSFDGVVQNVIGTSVKLIEAESPYLYSYKKHTSASKKSIHIARAFISESVQLFDPLVWAFAGSIENSSSANWQGAAQTSLIATPFENHTIRLMASRAPSVPSLLQTDTEANISNVNVGPPFGTMPVNLLGNENIKPMYINNLELALAGTYFKRRLSLDANLYYMTIEGLPTFVEKTDTTFFPTMSITTRLWTVNGNHAIARGVEGKATYKFTAGRTIFVNYAQEIITDCNGDVNITNGTPVHKLNAGMIMNLFAGLSVSTAASYKSAHRANSTSGKGFVNVDDYTRLDARLAWENEYLEIYAGGQHMLKEQHVEYPDGSDVPMLYYGGLNFKFGGSEQ